MAGSRRPYIARVRLPPTVGCRKLIDPPLQHADWLNLAKAPGFDRLYFLGAPERRITFYSQQVRALRLAHALAEADGLEPNERIGVIGAGAAGLTAAIAFALLGQRVTLYDKAGSAISLQSNSPRLLHPHIYEWPKLGSLSGQAILPFLDWTASDGKNVETRLRAAFNAYRPRLHDLHFKDGHTLASIVADGDGWRLEFEDRDPASHDRVIMAMGFGPEKPCGLAAPVDYWKHRSTGDAGAEAVKGTTYLVSGNGDGGLTDLLNLTIDGFEHAAFTTWFLGRFRGDKLREVADNIFACASPKEDLEPKFEEHLKPLLHQRGVIDDLKAKLREDRVVTCNASGPLFEFGKAAQLNQVMAFALLEATKAAERPIARSSGYVDDVTADGTRFMAVGPAIDGAPLTASFDHIILRHGPDFDAFYAPVAVPYAAHSAHVKALLGARPDLNDPPSLSPLTFAFFEKLKEQKLLDAVDQAPFNASTILRDSRLIIGRDQAAHLLTEQGTQSFGDLAEKCERLPAKVQIHIDATTAALGCKAELHRLARASNGRIDLLASPAVAADWPDLDSAAVLPAPYPLAPFDGSGIAPAIDACLLRLLDGEIAKLIADKTYAELGAIDESIIASIIPTWNDWHATLKAEPGLCSEFLRLLVHVDQPEKLLWDGNHAGLQDLGMALIMMLATHEGEALTPAITIPGNLSFYDKARALGSGCRKVRGRSIADIAKPEEWGVDALILSGTGERLMEEARSGSVSDGGTESTRLDAFLLPRPAVIQNDRYWRSKLGGDLGQWRAAVQKEFADWRNRQEEQLKVVQK